MTRIQHLTTAVLMTALMLIHPLYTAAQEQPQWVGFQIGYASPTLYEGLAQGSENYTLRGKSSRLDGLKVGFLYDATLIQGFGFTFGLNYTFGRTQNNWATPEGQIALYPQQRTEALYHQIEMPIEWQYKWEVAGNTWVIVYSGPTIQYHIAWNDNAYRRTKPDESLLTGHKNLFSKDDAGDFALSPLGVTWGLGLGFQYDKFFIRGGYDFGLINAYQGWYYHEDADTDHKIRSRFDQWQIKVGVYFLRF
ncbi:MAG: outer membrane beta-barrel protein [Paludibacteraceae bacterium]|nr:outer membrane beta-barrel protein [Paludibacteraceae bacterium]